MVSVRALGSSAGYCPACGATLAVRSPGQAPAACLKLSRGEIPHPPASSSSLKSRFKFSVLSCISGGCKRLSNVQCHLKKRLFGSWGCPGDRVIASPRPLSLPATQLTHELPEARCTLYLEVVCLGLNVSYFSFKYNTFAEART